MARHAQLLRREDTALVVVDVQEAFRGVVEAFDAVVARTRTLIEGARRLAVPVVVTEQYPKGLGRTAAEVAAVLPEGFEPVEKTAFSSCGAQAFIPRLRGAHQVLLCGIEAHVCVNQTAHDLLARGYQVHVLTDCVSSRAEQNRRVGLDKMFRSGALPSSTELALFELMRDARHEQFRAIQKLIK